jgi:hypothetical protein
MPETIGGQGKRLASSSNGDKACLEVEHG